MLYALTVGDDLAGEGRAYLAERIGEAGMSQTDGCTTGAGGNQQYRIVGRSIAIDGDAIEAELDGIPQICIEYRRFNGRVGEDIDEHRCVRHELRVNHARAFAEGGDAHFARGYVGTGNFDVREGCLLNRVSSENGAGGLPETIGVVTNGGGQGRK